MVFDLNGKVALITGGASGIGLQYAKELLRSGVKAVTLADLNPDFAKAAVAEIEKEFGPNKAIFVKTDVTDFQQFENAFKKTVEAFKHVDILFNNAGILNDKIWEKEIAININGVINGVLLGLDTYLPKYKQGDEAVIVNISSIAGLDIAPCVPVYTGTKAAVAMMTRSWGNDSHYDRTKVRVIAICPGVTMTPLITDMSGRNLGTAYENLLAGSLSAIPTQTPEQLAPNVVKVIGTAPTGTIWVVEGGQPPYQYTFPSRLEFAK